MMLGTRVRKRRAADEAGKYATKRATVTATPEQAAAEEDAGVLQHSSSGTVVESVAQQPTALHQLVGYKCEGEETNLTDAEKAVVAHIKVCKCSRSPWMCQCVRSHTIVPPLAVCCTCRSFMKSQTPSKWIKLRSDLSAVCHLIKLTLTLLEHLILWLARFVSSRFSISCISPLPRW
jgi:hypothetical protein